MSETETVPTPPAVVLLGVVCTPSHDDKLAEFVEGSLGWCRLSSWHDHDGYAVVLVVEGSSHAGIASTREVAAQLALDDALRTLDVLSKRSADLLGMRP